MRNVLLSTIIGLGILTTTNIWAVTCKITAPVNAPFLVDLKKCFADYPFPFNDYAKFEFQRDTIPPQSFYIADQYMHGSAEKIQDIDVKVVKRNYTLSLNGDVIIHIVDNKSATA